MSIRKEITICVAEKEEFQEFGDEMDSWHHAYLMLLDERGEEPSIIQEVHFNQSDLSKMVPNLREKQLKPLSKCIGVTVFPYFSGNEEDVLPVWNRALEHAAKLREEGDLRFGLDYRHDPNANNCRTGVKALIETMGIGFCREFTKNAAGTNSNAIPYGAPYKHFSNVDRVSPDELWAENQALAKRLEVDTNLFHFEHSAPTPS